MLERKYFVISIIAVYILMFVSIFTFKENKLFGITVCPVGSLCVRFCCRNATSCSDEFIRENFTHSQSIPEYKILKGPPTCQLILENSPPEFDVARGGFTIADGYVESSSYCFEESTEGNAVDWKLLVCQPSDNPEHTISRILFVVSAGFVGISVLFIAFRKKLRSTPHGKIEFILLISILVTQLMFPFVHAKKAEHVLDFIATYTLFGGLLIFFISMTILNIDLWWTLRNFRSSADADQRFKCYYYYRFAVIALISIATLVVFLLESEFTFISFATLIVLTAVADILLLVWTTIKVLQLSWSTDITDQGWFEKEKKRYFLYLEVLGILLLTWPLEINASDNFKSFESRIAVEVLKCFSSFLIFLIFVTEENV